MKKLLIVESPTKAKTISKFLGGDYSVISSFGHIRDLPKSGMGVDIENNFKPTYEVADDKKQKVADLKRAAKLADEIYLATDEDREGEAIAWHIAEILKLDTKKAKRITFHEITRHAIEEALSKPRHIDQHQVDAQQGRRILDRLVGYELSPFLWNKVRRGLSAGRVQSVAVRLIVERERERQAFKQEEYWTIEGKFASKDGQDFEAKLSKVDGKTLDKFALKNESEAQGVVDDLKGEVFSVGSVEKKKAGRKPPTPFRTSILQQEANSKLGFSAKQTMTLAQKLYETGRITYMRTDSLNLADKFLGETQDFIKVNFGDNYIKGPVRYKTGSKGAQEAHEAIRPTDVRVTPEMMKGKLESGQWRLYDLIWRRTVASQLPAAQIEQTGIELNAKNYTFKANGSVVTFDGFMKVYRGAKETILPTLAVGDKVDNVEILPEQHFTQPPARYSDASLIKILEEHGIGRPSTYAPTLSTIEARGYVERDEGKKLMPTDIAFIVNDLLTEHFAQIVDIDFTAKMEQQFDHIAEGKEKWQEMIHEFYTPFHKNLKEKNKQLKREDVLKPRELGKHPETGQMIYVRTGRFGSYLVMGEEDDKNRKNVSLLKDMHYETVTLEQAMEVLKLPRVVGVGDDGEEIVALIGPYGPYLKSGKSNASLPEDLSPLEVDLEQAKAILKEAIILREAAKKPLAELGEDPESKGQILVKTGRFGPYITDGKTNVSIPKSIDPATITFYEAVAKLAAKRSNPRARWAKAKEASSAKGGAKRKAVKKKSGVKKKSRRVTKKK
jgi:DNA topoisomerase-1